MSIGSRLKAERERLGMTQTEFAKIAADNGAPGATRQSQAKYEKDLSVPSATYISALATAGVDVLYLLTGVGLPPVVRHNLEAIIKTTAEIDPNGETTLTELMHSGFQSVASPPSEPEVKLSRKDRAFWEMYKELDEKDQREIYHDIQEKKRLAELEKYYQENERKKNA